jgi:2C-methyl-D-erythritol 2,4-cyclodiphosphate synthase
MKLLLVLLAALVAIAKAEISSQFHSHDYYINFNDATSNFYLQQTFANASDNWWDVMCKSMQYAIQAPALASYPTSCDDNFMVALRFDIDLNHKVSDTNHQRITGAYVNVHTDAAVHPGVLGNNDKNDINRPDGRLRAALGAELAVTPLSLEHVHLDPHGPYWMSSGGLIFFIMFLVAILGLCGVFASGVGMVGISTVMWIITCGWIGVMPGYGNPNSDNNKLASRPGGMWIMS